MTPEELFQTHFAPLYPVGESLDDLRATDANPAGNPAILAKLQELASTFEKLAPVALGKPDLALARDDASVLFHGTYGFREAGQHVVAGYGRVSLLAKDLCSYPWVQSTYLGHGRLPALPWLAERDRPLPTVPAARLA